MHYPSTLFLNQHQNFGNACQFFFVRFKKRAKYKKVEIALRKYALHNIVFRNLVSYY